jgi:hypothetical protein
MTMTLIRSLWSGALGLACVITSLSAHAVDFDGTFVGTVSLAEQLPRSQDPPHPASYYVGAPVVGSFALHLSDPQPFEPPGPNDAMFTDPGSVSFSYTLRGVSYSFDTGPGILLSLSTSPAGDPHQSLSVETTMGFFELAGPSGSLFSGLDASTLHIDPTAAYTGQNILSSAQAKMLFVVDMTQVNFQTTSPVPEPTTVALFTVGGVLLAWRLRRRAPDQGVGQRA